MTYNVQYILNFCGEVGTVILIIYGLLQYRKHKGN